MQFDLEKLRSAHLRLTLLFACVLLVSPATVTAEKVTSESNKEWLTNKKTSLWSHGVQKIRFDAEQYANNLKFSYRDITELKGVRTHVFSDQRINVKLTVVITSEEKDIFSQPAAERTWQGLRSHLTLPVFPDESENEIRQLRTEALGVKFQNEGYAFNDRPEALDTWLATMTYLQVTIKDEGAGTAPFQFIDCHGNVLDLTPRCGGR